MIINNKFQIPIFLNVIAACFVAKTLNESSFFKCVKHKSKHASGDPSSSYFITVISLSCFPFLFLK